MDNMTYFDFIELIEKQGEIIKQQAETIAKLINENMEQENIINILMQESLQLSSKR
jgi:hypothetical protein